MDLLSTKEVYDSCPKLLLHLYLCFSGGGRNKRQPREVPRQAFGLPGGGGNNNTAQSSNNSRMQYTYLNQMPYTSNQTAEYVENIAK